MWKPEGFEYEDRICEASLRAGAIVYRVTSESHSDPSCLLNGQGAILSAENGRYNAPGQITSYCASNVLVGFSEILFHMYRRTLGAIAGRFEREDVLSATLENKCLVALKLRAIPDLVYTDAAGVSDYESRLCGAAVVFPDKHYDFMHAFNNKMRGLRKRGILYPSARHSVGLCVALFRDETQSIEVCSAPIRVCLQLLPEHQALNEAPEQIVDPFRTKIHPTMGYYKVLGTDEFTQARNGGMLPRDLPAAGKIDFVRRNYRGKYPTKAVVS